jgi:hypothetical protein
MVEENSDCQDLASILGDALYAERQLELANKYAISGSMCLVQDCVNRARDGLARAASKLRNFPSPGGKPC